MYQSCDEKFDDKDLELIFSNVIQYDYWEPNLATWVYINNVSLQKFPVEIISWERNLLINNLTYSNGKSSIHTNIDFCILFKFEPEYELVLDTPGNVYDEALLMKYNSTKLVLKNIFGVVTGVIHNADTKPFVIIKAAELEVRDDLS